MGSAMSKPFSRRNKPRHEAFQYDVPLTTRLRIIASIKDCIDDFERFGRRRHNILNSALEEALKAVVRNDGMICVQNSGVTVGAALGHFQACSDEKALDFIEFVLQRINTEFVDISMSIVNQIFQEDGIGYELRFAPQQWENQPLRPEFIHKDGRFAHEEVVRPCLEALQKPALQTANKEMFEAFEVYRYGDYAGTIVKACASLESVLKTVLHKKGVTGFEKDALARLSDKCFAASVYPGFVNEIIKNTGAVRNNMGGHGGGPSPNHVASREYADYMLQLVSSNINLVTKLAGL